MPNLGTQQSPIDLTDPFNAELRVTIAWDALVLTLNDGNSIYQPARKLGAKAKRRAGHIVVDRERYIPVDLHWHFPAEHTVKGKQFPAEVHIVHVHKDDVQYALQGKLDWCRIVVLGIFLASSRRPYAPMEVAANGGTATIQRDAILPEKASALRYCGSLTTPPYSENVTFIVFETPMAATRAQLADGGLANARSLQDTNRRCCLRGDVAVKS